MAAAYFILDVAGLSLAVHQPLTGHEHLDELALGIWRSWASQGFSAVIAGSSAGYATIQLRPAGKTPCHFSLSSVSAQLPTIYKQP